MQFYYQDNDQWIPYSDDLNKELAKAKSEGKSECTLNINDSPYKVNFITKRQFSLLDDGRRRKIEFTSAEAPTPTATPDGVLQVEPAAVTSDQVIEYRQAICAFQPRSGRELQLLFRDVIAVVEVADDGWFEGISTRGRGLFPRNHTMRHPGFYVLPPLLPPQSPHVALQPYSPGPAPAPPQPVQPPSVKFKARMCFNFQGSGPEQLSCNLNDILLVHDEGSDGWSECTLEGTQRRGLVPTSRYTKHVDGDGSLGPSDLSTGSLSVSDRRRRYTCGSNYVTPDRIQTWDITGREVVARPPLSIITSDEHHISVTPNDLAVKKGILVNRTVNGKVAIFRGDITTLEIDCIVNAANEQLSSDGGGVDGALHKAAGAGLREACARVSGCPIGEVRVTDGFNLPARHVMHAVGPTSEDEPALARCYRNILSMMATQRFRTIGICCISTGMYGFPPLKAAHIALKTVRAWLEEPENADKVDKIIFVVYSETAHKVYEALFPAYFPLSTSSLAAVEESMDYWYDEDQAEEKGRLGRMKWGFIATPAHRACGCIDARDGSRVRELEQSDDHAGFCNVEVNGNLKGLVPLNYIEWDDDQDGAGPASDDE